MRHGVLVLGLLLCTLGPDPVRRRSARALVGTRQRVVAPPRVERLYRQRRARLAGESFETLLRRRPRYLERLSLDVERAEHHRAFLARFQLSDRARATLRRLGFVVVPSPSRSERSMQPGSGAGPADVFYRVFAADLPVFVSVDSVLHAWHRSFEEIFATAEEALMLDNLHELLARSMAALGLHTQSERDALLYLAVARGLLEPEWKPPAALASELARFRRAFEIGLPVPMPWAGGVEIVDISQLRPRGHYTRSQHLARYFMAMMWLGRMELTLFDPERRAITAREEAAARTLVGAMARGDALAALGRIERFYRELVGPANAVGPERLLGLCRAAGLSRTCQGRAEAMAPVYAALDAPAYSGRFHAADRRTIALRLLPQRFGYDAWVLSRTTVPELAPPSDDGEGRSMASPFDVAYALGSDRALEHLVAEERGLPHREELPRALEAARRTLEALPPTRLADSVYNHWLEAQISIARTRLDERLPAAMRTAAWHDRRLEALLASWAELRHDTVLVVEQSAGGVGCQYPKGYVEPIPELYRDLARAAGRLERLLGKGALGALRAEQPRPESKAEGFFDSPASPDDLRSVTAFAAAFQQTMERLARLAEDELAGRATSRDDLLFLNRTVDRHAEGYGGVRLYDGWYPGLYWKPRWGEPITDFMAPVGHKGPPYRHWEAGISKPIAADVHTDADQRRVLQLGVGHPSLLVIAIEDRRGGLALYGGPVSSFYLMERPVGGRLADAEWRTLLDGPTPPPPPSFAREYRAR
jgi:hypothetical protein